MGPPMLLSDLLARDIQIEPYRSGPSSLMCKYLGDVYANDWMLGGKTNPMHIPWKDSYTELGPKSIYK